MGQSNTQDSVHDTATGGHLVQITRDSNGDYVLTDPTDPSNTRTVPDVTANGSNFDVYNPLSDSFITVSAGNLTAAQQFAIYLPETDSFRNVANGDTFWKTRFNSYTHALNNVSKIRYTASGASNVLSARYDAGWIYAGGTVISEITQDPLSLDVTIRNTYGDGTFEQYRTLLIDDLGKVAPIAAFDGISTGAAYKNELLKWNYEQQITATEFGGRKIDLVVEPRIFIDSGLIQ